MLSRWTTILIFVITSCSSKKDDLRINVLFKHSFAHPLKLTVEKTKNTSKAFVEVLKYEKSYDSLVLITHDSSILSKEELEKFFDILGNTSLLELYSDSSGMFVADGGATYFSVVQGTTRNDFIAGDFAALNKGNRYQQLLDATFYLLYAKFPDLEKFIEQNHRYHLNDLPVKIRGKNPRQIRLWANYFDNDSVLLSEFLKEFPQGEPLIVDISNIESFAHIESSLLHFQTTHPKIVWVIGDVERNYSNDIWEAYKRPGLDTARMFKDTIEAKNYLLRLENGG